MPSTSSATRRLPRGAAPPAPRPPPPAGPPRARARAAPPAACSGPPPRRRVVPVRLPCRLRSRPCGLRCRPGRTGRTTSQPDLRRPARGGSTGKRVLAYRTGVGDVFRALADPTRRALLDELQERDDQTLFELCTRLAHRGVGSSRQAVSQHLDVLEQRPEE